MEHLFFFPVHSRLSLFRSKKKIISHGWRDLKLERFLKLKFLTLTERSTILSSDNTDYT